MQSEQTGDLSTALAKAQAAMKPAVINKVNPHFKNKYADLTAVLDAIRKPLAENGLSVTQTTEVGEGAFLLVTTLRHSTGQWVSSAYPLPLAGKPQELGSALTYARRYSLSAMLCISADEDDDAELAHNSNGHAKASPIKPQIASPPTHPETGEVSPHPIAEQEGTQQWGQAFIAAVKLAKTGEEIDQWVNDNAAGLDALKGASEKAYSHVMAAVETRRKELKQKAAA
jgi:hypothetical protein